MIRNEERYYAEEFANGFLEYETLNKNGEAICVKHPVNF